MTFVNFISKLATMRTSVYITACVFVFTLASCSKKDDKNGACGKGKEEFFTSMPSALTFEAYNGANTLQSGKIFYTYVGGATPRVQFFIGGTVTNICTDEHMKVNYSFYLTTASQPVPLTITGEALWHALLGYEKIVMVSGTVTPGLSLTNSYLELGLVQVFQDQPATVDVFNTVEFDSQGSFSADSAYFMNHVQLLDILSNYSKAS